jgi:beta-glucosidase
MLDGFYHPGRLWLDGKMMVDDHNSHDSRPMVAEAALKKGRWYALKLEYFQGRARGVKLVWRRLSRCGRNRQASRCRDRDDGNYFRPGRRRDGRRRAGLQGGDRTSLDLLKEEVVVLMNGNALSANWADGNANAILDAWYSGEEGGTAIAESLAGVNNTSECDGDEVVQLYLSFPKSPGAPIHALRGMTRIHLAAGESEHVRFTLDAQDLSGVNSQGDRIVAAEAYRLPSAEASREQLFLA